MLLEPRNVKLTTRTGIEISRTLPNARKRMIGAWAFADHFGPTVQADGMVVAAHPHTGLQTATWLIEGSIEHRDSLGSVQQILPGQVNIMTAGQGISHSELSQIGPENLHAVQLWVALPQQFSGIQPLFEHRADLPVLQLDGAKATVFAGDFGDSSAKMTIFSELVGLELDFEGNARLSLPLRPDFEYGLLMVGGSAQVNGQHVAENELLYIEVGESELNITTTTPAKAILVGGVPFGEKIVMWWNFVASSQKEITEAREQWNARDARFGDFEDQIGGWIPAPELPHVNLQPR